MTRNLPLNWIPDSKISKVLRPYYDRGFTASAVSTFLIRDINGNPINIPNVKTCYQYWKYWKYVDSKKILCSIRAYVKSHQKHLEKFYLSQYDKLLLVSYDMEKTLEKESNSANDSYDSSEHLEINIDTELEILSLRIIHLESGIRMRKYITENNLILYYFKFNYSTLIQKITIATHKMLIRMLNFLSKRRGKKFVLDCQCEKKELDQTVIKCGICASKVVPLIHLNFC